MAVNMMNKSTANKSTVGQRSLFLVASAIVLIASCIGVDNPSSFEGNGFIDPTVTNYPVKIDTVYLPPVILGKGFPTGQPAPNDFTDRTAVTVSGGTAPYVFDDLDKNNASSLPTGFSLVQPTGTSGVAFIVYDGSTSLSAQNSPVTIGVKDKADKVPQGDRVYTWPPLQLIIQNQDTGTTQAVAPSISLTTIENVQRGPVVVEYRLSDPNADAASVSIEYCFDVTAATPTWLPATRLQIAGSEDTNLLDTLPSPGKKHWFIWDSYTDATKSSGPGATYQANVSLRATPANITGDDATRFGTQVQLAAAFKLDNTTMTAPTSGSEYYAAGATAFIGTDATGVPPVSTSADDGTNLASPSAIATNGTYVAVADTSYHRVLVWSDVTASSFAVSSSVVIGQTSNNLSGSSPGPNRSGTTVSGATLNSPSGVAFYGNKLYVADTGNNRVLIFDDVTTLVGDGTDTATIVLGQASFSQALPNQGSNLPSDRTLNSPKVVSIHRGYLFVGDSGNKRVMLWKLSSISANNASADSVVGKPDFITAAGTGSDLGANGLGTVTGINHYARASIVSDSSAHRVMIYDQLLASDGPPQPGTTANYVLGHGSSGFNAFQPNNGNGATGAVRADGFYIPAGIAFDANKLLIADSGNNRVMIYTSFPTSSGASATALIGASSLAASAKPASGTGKAQHNQPNGVLFIRGRLFIVDSLNHRVKIY
ncbi:MAG: NHL repeat-containing protein [Planctomycetes bacterium]|nr:NHL repeat-containing protein [Planctomycetota bacterium]